MNYSFGNNNSNRTHITNVVNMQQQLFKRFQRRFNNTSNSGERTFLKQEMTRIANELKNCSRRWKNCGFGGTSWITNGYNAPSIGTTGRWTSGGKTTKTSSKNRRGRTTGSRNNNRGTKSRTSRRGNRTTGGRKTSRSSTRRTGYSFAW